MSIIQTFVPDTVTEVDRRQRRKSTHKLAFPLAVTTVAAKASSQLGSLAAHGVATVDSAVDIMTSNVKFDVERDDSDESAKKRMYWNPSFYAFP